MRMSSNPSPQAISDPYLIGHPNVKAGDEGKVKKEINHKTSKKRLWEKEMGRGGWGVR